MRGTYTFERRYYVVDVIAVGVFCAALALWAAWGLIGGSAFPVGILWAVLLVCGYQVWNTFVAIANPEKVTLTDDELVFQGFGRTDRFPLSGIRELSVREVGGKEKLYVRVNGGGPVKGRYWVQAGHMAGGLELAEALEALEERVHPDSLKARARRSNRVYAEHEDQIKARIKADKEAEKAQKRARRAARPGATNAGEPS